MKEAKYLEKQKRQVEQKTREWQRPRARTPAQQRTKEEGARSRRAVLSSFAKSTKTNEQKKVRVVVPAEVPHDMRKCIEDLVDTNFDESDVEELRAEKKKTARDWDPRIREQKSSANSRQKSELSEADFERDELHRALSSALETKSHCVL